VPRDSTASPPGKGAKKKNNNKEEEKSFSFWLEVSAGSLCCHDYSR